MMLMVPFRPRTGSDRCAAIWSHDQKEAWSKNTEAEVKEPVGSSSSIFSLTKTAVVLYIKSVLTTMLMNQSGLSHIIRARPFS